MAVAISGQKFYPFSEHIAEKVHNLGSDALKLLLTNSAPSQSNSVRSQITEIAAGNGYGAAGISVSVSSSSQTTGTYTLVVGNVTLTASGGSIGPFRYVVLCNHDGVFGSPSDPLIGFWDLGASYTLVDGESLDLTLGTIISFG